MKLKLGDISIKWQLMVICVTLATIPIVTLGIISYSSVKKESIGQIEQNLRQQVQMLIVSPKNVYKIAQEKVSSDLNSAEKVLYDSGRPALSGNDDMEVTATNQVTNVAQKIRIPSMKISGKKIANNYEIVDEIQRLVGGTATIFQAIPGGMLRISTNVMKLDKTRAVGTYIPSDSPVYQSVMAGNTYYGRAFVVNAWYVTAYKPIKDASGGIIGVLYVGVNENQFQDPLKDAFSRITVGKTGYLYVLNSKGEYILSPKRQSDGKNIWDSKDADGKFYIQEIINKAKSLKEGETALHYYPWKDEGESGSRMKLTSFAYFPDWDWVLASTTYQDDFFDNLTNIRRETSIVVISAILIGSLIAYLFAFYITSAFKKLIEKVNKVAEQDLTVDLDLENAGENEIGQITHSFGVMLNNLRQLISKIVKNAATAAAAAEKLSNSSHQINNSMAQVSTTIQQVSTGAQNTSKGATEVQTATKKTSDSAQVGSGAAKAVGEKMNLISVTTKAGADKIKGLGEKSKEIGQIVETINSISDQTNLLALNAAIEAARAGEAGRGFAVVADEVRKLAEQSTEATAQISELISGIQSEMQSSVESMDKNVKEVGEGVIAVKEAIKSFEGIPTLVDGITRSISEMAAIAEENAAGSEEVSSLTEEVTASMEEISSVAEGLNDGAGELKQLVAAFKVDKIDEAQPKK